MRRVVDVMRELGYNDRTAQQIEINEALALAKAGILGFTRHLAKESAGYGITVNSVCPGLIDTEMVRSTLSAADAKAHTHPNCSRNHGVGSSLKQEHLHQVTPRGAHGPGHAHFRPPRRCQHDKNKENQQHAHQMRHLNPPL